MTLGRVVILNDLSQAKGGATGLAMLAARRLSAAGLEVAYVCGDAGHGEALPGIQLQAAGSDQLLRRHPVHAMRAGIYNRATRDMVADFIARTDTARTVYHLHGWAQILSPSVFDALAPVAQRTFIHAHDMFLACPNGVYMDYQHNAVCARTPLSAACLATHCDKRSRAHKAWRVLRQRALWRAMRGHSWAGILPIHPGMEERLRRAGHESVPFHVVRNPAIPFLPMRVKAEENTGVVFVGRLEEDKGALDLARAAARTGTDVTFIGEGALRPELERDYPQMPVTGWLSRDQIGAHIARARALVMPSRHPEPFALVLPEAALSGLPLAVARTALMAQEIEARGIGLAFDVFDEADFDAALIRLTEMPPDATRAMSEAARNATALAHSEESWIAALRDLYETVL